MLRKFKKFVTISLPGLEFVTSGIHLSDTSYVTLTEGGSKMNFYLLTPHKVTFVTKSEEFQKKN